MRQNETKWDIRLRFLLGSRLLSMVCNGPNSGMAAGLSAPAQTMVTQYADRGILPLSPRPGP